MNQIAEQEVVKRDLRRIMEIYRTTEGTIRPHFILTGPSGSGKTHTIQTLCAEFGLNFFEINAAQLTKEGTSGNSLSKALAPIGQRPGLGICFIDEFDKLFISGNQNSELAHETTNGVQNEFLKVLESRNTSVFGDYGKYVDIKIDHILFIFAGAFNGQENLSLDELRSFGIKTEFLGRVGLIYNLEKLSINSMYAALQNSELFNHYLRLFPEVHRKQAEADIMGAVQKNFENNTLGIRLLTNLMHQYFIKGGLTETVVNTTTFQTTLSFKPDPVGQIV